MQITGKEGIIGWYTTDNSITRVDYANNVENPYRVKALIYINRGEEVPEELKKQIARFDAKYKQKKRGIV